MSQPRHTFVISSRQLFLVIVSVVALASIVIPIAAGASTGSFVNIRDPFSTASSGQARVVNGRLTTMTCDPLTGSINGNSCLRVNGGKVGVDGVVLSRPVSSTLHTLATVTSNAGTTLFGPYAAGTKFNFATFTMANTGTAGPLELRVRLIHNNTSDCLGAGTVQSEVEWVSVPQNQTVTVSYSAPLLVTAPSSAGTLCVIAFTATSPAGAEVRVTASGFLG